MVQTDFLMDCVTVELLFALAVYVALSFFPSLIYLIFIPLFFQGA